MDNFDPAAVTRLLVSYGLKQQDGQGRSPLVTYISLRMPNRGGAEGGTPELYLTDPDGLAIQLQDVKYCGGGGFLGEACPPLPSRPRRARRRGFMRLSFSAALSAAVAGLLVTSGYAQVKRGSEGAFSAARLTAPPTTGWPTNGGNLYNQRYSPLKAIDRANVAQLKGVWRARLRGSGTAPQYSGFAQPIVDDGVAYVSTGANDVFALSIDTGEILWQYAANLDPNITSVCCGWNNKGVAISEDKVFIGRLDGQLVALDRATGRSRVVDSGRALAGQLLDHRRAPLRQRHGHRRFRRRRSRYAQPPQGLRPEGWPPDLDLLHHPRSWRARS